MKVKLLWLFSILVFLFSFLLLIAAQHRGRMSRYLRNNQITAWNWTKSAGEKWTTTGVQNDDGYLDSVLHPLGVLQSSPGQSCVREERRAHPQNHSHEWYAFEVKKILFFFCITLSSCSSSPLVRRRRRGENNYNCISSREWIFLSLLLQKSLWRRKKRKEKKER